jgi:hypothetical protein
MCRRITCSRCGRPSFAGCGAHVEQVLGDVPRAERCQCSAKAQDGAAPADAGRKPWWKLL